MVFIGHIELTVLVIAAVSQEMKRNWKWSIQFSENLMDGWYDYF